MEEDLKKANQQIRYYDEAYDTLTVEKQHMVDKQNECTNKKEELRQEKTALASEWLALEKKAWALELKFDRRAVVHTCWNRLTILVVAMSIIREILQRNPPNQ